MTPDPQIPPGWRILHDEAEDGVWTVLLQAWWDPWGWHVAAGEAPTREEAIRLAVAAAKVEDGEAAGSAGEDGGA